ncbi:MAG: hypothetical protein GEU95_01295 [Rhizobiales bacterium]|nr:hypothetical protein [Hyphomicrobiales bacterium]
MTATNSSPMDAKRERLRQKMVNWRRKNKEHLSEYRKRRYQKHRKRILAQLAAARKLNPDADRKRQRRHRIKRAYGITLEQWDALFDAQGRKCANPGCSVTDQPLPKWHVDHCHRTQAVRGILCYACNTALGLLGDDVQKLQGAIEYLRRFACLTDTVTTPSP